MKRAFGASCAPDGDEHVRDFLWRRARQPPRKGQNEGGIGRLESEPDAVTRGLGVAEEGCDRGGRILGVRRDEHARRGNPQHGGLFRALP